MWRVLRGGSWSQLTVTPVSTSFREWHSPAYHDISYGFRCVQDMTFD